MGPLGSYHYFTLNRPFQVGVKQSMKLFMALSNEALRIHQGFLWENGVDEIFWAWQLQGCLCALFPLSEWWMLPSSQTSARILAFIGHRGAYDRCDSGWTLVHEDKLAHMMIWLSIKCVCVCVPGAIIPNKPETEFILHLFEQKRWNRLFFVSNTILHTHVNFLNSSQPAEFY